MKILRKSKLKYIRSYIRGYLKLKSENNLGLITKLKNQLANTNIPFENEVFSQQFLVSRLLGLDFNKEIQIAYLRPSKQVNLPLPYLWRLELEKYGFKAVKFTNAVRWKSFVLKWYFYGVFSMGNELFRYFSNPYKVVESNSFAFFINLSKENLPDNNGNTNRNIINYYLEKGYIKVLDRIYHTVRSKSSFSYKEKEISYLDSPIPNINSFSKLFIFSLWSSKQLLKSLVHLFKGDDTRLLLLREFVLNKVFELDCSNNEKQYFFHNSTHIFRPLWTYLAEDRGNNIIFYLYSMNNYPITTQQNPEFIRSNHWDLVSWPEIWTWNKFSKMDLESIIKYKVQIKVVEPIWFSSFKEFNFSEFKSLKKLALFDIQPPRIYHTYSLGNSFDYYNIENSKKFMSDVLLAAKKANYHVFFKRKRPSSLVDSTYLRFLDDLKIKFENFTEIPAENDPISIIENVDKVISMPFTSTALLGQFFNKKSIYYDVTSSLIKRQKASYDIEIKSNIDELYTWLSE